MPEELNIIEYINGNAENIAEDELDDQLVPQLLSYYETRINYLAYKAYNESSTMSPVATAAFKELAKEELSKALFTYLFSSEHWRTGRNVDTYLHISLNRLSDRTRWDLKSAKKVNIPICPGCKDIGLKEYLHTESKMLRCSNCTNESERIVDERKKINTTDIKIALERRLQIHSTFALHSRRGYRCPECERFIPDSHADNFGIACPFPECTFFGRISDLIAMAHPTALGSRVDFSLDSAYGKEDKGTTGYDIYGDKLKSREANADDQIAMEQRFKSEINTLNEVIDLQTDRLKNNGLPGTYTQKVLMYQAYKNMLIKYPEEMVSYLVHLRQSTEFPIQSRIFQEYVSLIKDAMPFTIRKSGDEIDIISLTDPNIGLFAGLSKYNAVVMSNKTIPNNTIEIYAGGVKARYHGPCFIGELIDVIDKTTGKSIKDHVLEYSFVQIQMDASIAADTPVEVSHFRLIPHYEMGNLVYLQRIRRKIVDSVYFKINGEHREVRKVGLDED